MIKEALRPSQIAVIAAFVLGTFCVGIYLWIHLNGPTPLKARGYRVELAMPSAVNVTSHVDVRIAGVNVGTVVSARAVGKRSQVEIELSPEYAPIPADTHATLRTKTLGGEAYLELSPGSPSGPKLPDGGSLAPAAVGRPVAVEDFLSIYDRPTRRSFKRFTQELADQVPGTTGEDLNQALGQLAPFSEQGAELLQRLEARQHALNYLVRNTGVVYAALNERRDQLRQLVVNSQRFFQATAEQRRALAQAIDIFPTFLDESKRLYERVDRFSKNAEPLIRDLKPVTRPMVPVINDLGKLSRPLAHYYALQRPLRDASEKGLPAATAVINASRPAFDAVAPYLGELNPILAYANYAAPFLASFMVNQATCCAASIPTADGRRLHYFRGFLAITGATLQPSTDRPSYDRGNAYVSPDAYERATRLGIVESADCAPSGGQQPEPSESSADMPPCFVAPPSKYDGHLFPYARSGEASLRHTPGGPAGPRQGGG